jgi:hypothetical protein
MTYVFNGFFASLSSEREALLSDIRSRWPGCSARPVDSPFRGIGVSLPDYGEAPSVEEAEWRMELLDAVWDGLPELSRDYPGVTFVWIDAFCSGRCFHEGTVYRNSQTLAEEKGFEGALTPLVVWLGCSLPPNEYFEPFERGWFDRGV